jgi:site-specific DNA recombinase
MINIQCYTVGIYCRLSLDDDIKGESGSIVTQKQILEKYVREQNWTLEKTYVDDGYSGTTFERPGFKQMIIDIENGKINCVITKDLSRLGRNYIQTGLYTDYFFPENKIRYIAINDNYDSEKGDNELAPFKNIMNEWYSRDQSKKIKSAKRNKSLNGQSIASFPQMGYLFDPNNRGKYIIDKEYAPIINQMFEWSAHGMGLAMIAKELYKLKIPRPTAVMYERKGTYAHLYESQPEDIKYRWEIGQIHSILHSETYLGKLISHKLKNTSYKNKKKITNPVDEWLVLENMHEPIVSQELFDIVQKKLASRKVPNKKGEWNMFAGLLKCKDCGKPMRVIDSIQGVKRKRQINWINCNTFIKLGKNVCRSHYMSYYDFLYIIKSSLRKWINEVDIDEKGLIARIIAQNQKAFNGQTRMTEKDLNQISKRLAELDNLFASVYEDKVSGKVSERNFEMLNRRYQTEQELLEQRKIEITSQLENQNKNEQDVRKWIELIKKYKEFSDLDREMLNELFEVIFIHEPQIIDGKKQIEVEIHYNFVGTVD